MNEPQAVLQTGTRLDPNRLRLIAIAIFGVVVIGSGLWRFLTAEGGSTGLWFGVVMGGLGLLSSGLFAARVNLAAHGLAWICLVLVGGWFGYEALIEKGIADAEPRQLIVIVVTLITLGPRVSHSYTIQSLPSCYYKVITTPS